MTLSTTCRQCGSEYEPDAASIKAGRWQICPQCRQTQPEPPHEATSDNGGRDPPCDMRI